MRWPWYFLCVFLLVGCSSKKDPSSSQTDDVFGQGPPASTPAEENSTPESPLPQPTLQKNQPTYPVQWFLTYVKAGKLQKARTFLTEDSRKIFTEKRIPKLQSFYVLGTIKTNLVNSKVVFRFKNGTSRAMPLTWIVQKKMGDWKIYAIQGKGYKCFFNVHNPAQAETLALAILKSLQKKANYYRLQNGSYVNLDEMIRKKYLAKVLKGGVYKNYRYSIEPRGGDRVSFRAVPLVLFPLHLGFYLDETNLIRCATDGAFPTASCPPLKVAKKD